MTDKRLEERARTDKGASAVHRLMREELQNFLLQRQQEMQVLLLAVKP
jgi:hypothetical protein